MTCTIKGGIWNQIWSTLGKSPWFASTGHIVAISLVERRPVNGHWYSEVCLPQLLAAVEDKRPFRGLRGLLLHQDNASAHTAQLTREYLERKKGKLVDHPPQSYDLAPCDFVLFPKTKEMLKGKRFGSAEEAVDAYKEVISAWPTVMFKKAIESWFYHMKLCIAPNGDYFEKN